MTYMLLVDVFCAVNRKIMGAIINVCVNHSLIYHLVTHERACCEPYRSGVHMGYAALIWGSYVHDQKSFLYR